MKKVIFLFLTVIGSQAFSLELGHYTSDHTIYDNVQVRDRGDGQLILNACVNYGYSCYPFVAKLEKVGTDSFETFQAGFQVKYGGTDCLIPIELRITSKEDKLFVEGKVPSALLRHLNRGQCPSTKQLRYFYRIEPNAFVLEQK